MSNQPPYGQPQGGGYPPPPPPQGDGKTKVLSMSYNAAALICYIPTCFCCINLIPCILWLATEPRENRLLRFHALQGLLLFGVWFVLWIVFTIIGFALGASMSVMPGDSGLVAAGGGLVLFLIRLCVAVGLIIVHVVAMIKANSGQMWKLPVIGDIAEKNS
ncbi:MAG: hypothetical protein AABO41_08915 [Acidobacteriota bacterium]